MVEEEIEMDVEIKSPAHKFHRFVGSQDVSKAAPAYIQRWDLHEGEWEKVGCILLVNLVVDGEPRASKDKVEVMDTEKNVIQWRVLEGPVTKAYKNFFKTMRVSPKEGECEGSVVNWNLKYERIHEKVDHPENVLQFLVGVTKEVDQYTLSNGIED